MNNINVQITSGTAGIEEYKEENFQLTYDEVISGNRNIYQAGFSSLPTPRLTVIDGNLFVLHEGAPPNSRTLPESAGILKVR